MIAILIAISALITLNESTAISNCKNYVFVDPVYLYPVGQCYKLASKENTLNFHATGFECESDGNGSVKAVEYTYSEDTTCNGTKTATGVEFSCNGPEQENMCQCEIGKLYTIDTICCLFAFYLILFRWKCIRM